MGLGLGLEVGLGRQLGVAQGREHDAGHVRVVSSLVRLPPRGKTDGGMGGVGVEEADGHVNSGGRVNGASGVR